MDEILHQLGGLLLGSVPTMLLFLLIVISYWALVYRPLMRVLEERRARTAGALKQANDAIASADQRARDYETRLREARLAVFEAREQRLRRWNSEKETVLKETHGAAQLKVAEAKAALAEETEAAHSLLDRSAEDLAREILRAILPPESALDLEPAGSGR